MKQKSLDQIRALARVTPIEVSRDRYRDRLRRWAALLLERPEQPLRALTQVELYSEAHRVRLRADNSPMALAYADPAFRTEGLAGDTLGDVQTFFGLSKRDAHRLLCDCRYNGRMNGRSVGRRLMRLAEPGLLQRMMQSLTPPPLPTHY
jgi:hypothetical protein